MHYATHLWCDFVRSLTPNSVTAEMRAHLTTGCEKCNRSARIMRKIAAFAAAYQADVPSPVVRKANAIYFGPDRPESLSRTVARIVFDTFSSPLPQGVRSRAHVCRQAMFEAGDVLVDVRLQETAEGSFLITGQIANRMAPTRRMHQVALHLISGPERRCVQPNRFGEFQTVYHTGGNVRLEITDHDRKIEVPLFQLNPSNEMR